MKNKQNHNNPMLATGAVATAFTGGNSIMQGLAIMYLNGGKQHIHFTNASFTMVVAVAMTILAFVFGIIAIKNNKKFAFISAICLFVATVIQLSCLAIPNLITDPHGILPRNGEAMAMLFAASLCTFICALLFIFYFLYAPKKTEYFNASLNTKEILDKIQNIKLLFDEGVLSEEEYNVKKQNILTGINKKEILETQRENVSKKKKFVCIFTPLIVMISLLAITVPSVYFGICYNIYSQLKVEMQDVKWNDYSYISSNVWNSLAHLPDDYRDVKNIKEEYLKFYKSKRIIEGKGYMPTGDDFREAYLTCKTMSNNNYVYGYNWQWNYDVENIENFEISYNSFYDTTWKNGENELKFLNLDTVVDTNLPIPTTTNQNQEAVEYEKNYYININYDDNSLVIKYQIYVDDHTEYKEGFTISNYRYDNMYQKFCINIFCHENGLSYLMFLED